MSTSLVTNIEIIEELLLVYTFRENTFHFLPYNLYLSKWLKIRYLTRFPSEAFQKPQQRNREPSSTAVTILAPSSNRVAGNGVLKTLSLKNP